MKINPLDIFYAKDLSPLEFKFESLVSRPLFSMLPYNIDSYLYSIATKAKYSGNIGKKYELMDAAMKDFGFDMLARGTNRSVYKYYNDDSIVVKVGIDKAGIGDAIREYNNQQKLKPFCTKTFEVSPSGAIGLFERVVPFTYKDEFVSVAEDIFDLLVKCILGKYVLADIGTDFYMNWGLRKGFGPVLIDYPFMYELDSQKLHCINTIQTPHGLCKCDGLIDYDSGFNKLVCERCGKTYFASDLMKVNSCGELEIVSGAIGGRKMGVKVYEGSKLVFDNGRKLSFKSEDSAPKRLVPTYEEGVDRRPKSRLDYMESKGKRPEQTYQKNNPPVPEQPVQQEDHFAYVDRKLRLTITTMYYAGFNTDQDIYSEVYAILKYISYTDKGIVFTKDIEDVAKQYVSIIKREFQKQEEVVRQVQTQQQNEIEVSEVPPQPVVQQQQSFSLSDEDLQQGQQADDDYLLEQYHQDDKKNEERQQILDASNQLNQMTQNANPNSTETSQEVLGKINQVQQEPKPVTKTPSPAVNTPYGKFKF